MTKVERRIKNFSSGLKKLGNDNQNYIHKITHDLFLIEKFTACSVLVKESTELEENNVTKSDDYPIWTTSVSSEGSKKTLKTQS